MTMSLETIGEELVYFVNTVKERILPTKGKNYAVIITPLILALLPSIYLFDIIWSYLLCNDTTTICSEVYQLSWGAFSTAKVKDNPATLFTYAFHHVNVSHLLNNWILTLIFYSYLERRVGWVRILFAKIFTLLGASFFWWLFTTSGRLYTVSIVGYSGVVYAGFLLFLVEGILNWNEYNSTDNQEKRSIVLWLIVLIALIVTLIVETIPYITNDITHQVATLAHLGGAFSGCWYSFIFMPNYKIKKWEIVVSSFSFLFMLLHLFVVPLVLWSFDF